MDNKKIPTSIGAIVLIVIAVTVSMFIWVYERSQGWDTDMAVMRLRRDQKETTKEDKGADKEVSFCGKVYKTNGAIVDGVDVVERVAEIATKNPNDYVCDNVNRNETTDVLQARLTIDENGRDFYVSIHSYFLVTNGEIYKLSGFDGTPSFYGNLK